MDVEERGPGEAASRADALPATLRAAVEGAYGIALGPARKLIGLGDECDIWRVPAADGDVIVRASPAWRSERRLRWTYRLLAHLAARVPEVTSPLVTAYGATVISWGGGPVAVHPWIEGEPLDDEDPSLCDAAARLLARLHNVMLPYAGLSYAEHRAPVRAREDLLADETLDAELAALYGDHRLLRGQVHGDYYPRNLICRDGGIAGVIDWDDTRIDLLMAELAWSIWEFGQHPEEPDLDVARARRFLARYREAGGPAPASEDRHIVPLIRRRLRDEVRTTLARPGEQSDDDKEYTDREIAAFERLRGREIEW